MANQTSFRLSDELLRQLRHACIDRGVTQQVAVEQAIQLWLAGGLPNTDLLKGAREADVPAIMAFPRYLKEGPPREVRITKDMIQSWVNEQATKKKKA